MKKPIFACALLTLTATALAAQQANPYEGYADPPAEDYVASSASTPAPAVAKPSAARTVTSAPPSAAARTAPPPAPGNAAMSFPDPDGGIVSDPAYVPEPQKQLASRLASADPDGDIVHPTNARPGQLAAGTAIWVSLLERISSANAAKGQKFHSRVVVDVMNDGKTMIPAGAELSGTIVQVSTGSFGGHGSLRLRPELVVTPTGERYRIQAELTGTTGSETHMAAENTIVPNPRVKRGAIEYGGVAGGGALAGAVIAGPVGALAGGAVGAGIVTVHLLKNHAQANLDRGSSLRFTLTESLDMTELSGAAARN